MPEGDEVYRFAARIRLPLEGKVVRAARARGPGPIPDATRLVGATCTAVETHGKNIVIRFDNGLALRGHLRMYGAWHVYRHGEAWRRSPSQARLILETDDAVVVNFSAPVIELMDQCALPGYTPLASLGEDLLDDTYDVPAAVARFRDPLLAGQTIGDAIMDQRVMAGVGNIWKHETLFRGGVHPWRTVGELSEAELEGIVTMARDLLRAAARLPGPLTTGRYPTMFVYARAGRPCRRCFTRIRSAPQGNDHRFTAWCPRCQPEHEGQSKRPQPVRRRPGGTAAASG